MGTPGREKCLRLENCQWWSNRVFGTVASCLAPRGGPWLRLARGKRWSKSMRTRWLPGLTGLGTGERLRLVGVRVRFNRLQADHGELAFANAGKGS
jgi:hypothetical protein